MNNNASCAQSTGTTCTYKQIQQTSKEAARTMLDLQILHNALGGVIYSGKLYCPGPGHSHKDRSLLVTVSPESKAGFKAHSFAGDDWKECYAHIRAKLGLGEWQPGDNRDRSVAPEKLIEHAFESIKQEEGPRELTADERRNMATAIEVWNSGVDPRDTLAQKYLNEHRLLELPDTLACNVLRFHPRCPWRDENEGYTVFIPAMIAAFRSIDTGEITAIHRIAIEPDGSKFDRMMLGPVHRAAVKLQSVVGDTLAIGEGVETCMAAREMGITSPVWAVGSTGGISKFPILEGVKTLVILGEKGEASAKAVNFCTRRWITAGRKVERIMPDEPFSDLNDELFHMKRKAAKSRAET
jgi:putative DNA primase/helicase